MSLNGMRGDNRRHGYVGGRTQSHNPRIGLWWEKRDTTTGQFMDTETSGSKIKGIRKEK